MAAHETTDFLAGVIEGFYGPPWTQAERFELFEWMAGWGLNTYLYAPKDDLKHRTLWRESYTETEAAELGEIIRATRERGLRFIYALSPGLDIRYADAAELDHLKRRCEQMLALGCGHFALLFDDIPDHMAEADRAQFGSFASAQCHVANALFRWTRERLPQARFLFCPTPYCGRMAERQLGGEHYLPTLGRDLLPEIEVFWTGPEIISKEIPLAHVREWQTLLRRQPLLWDNLHANDYDGSRFYCGPYSGRPPELRNAVSGILVNPNNEFPLNYVPLRTLAAFVHGPESWDARRAYLSAMQEWLPRFATVGKPVTLEDLILLGDCHYLPHEEGPEAETFYQNAHALLAAPPAKWGDRSTTFRQQTTRLREVCARMAELRHRPLFHALSRRVWALREEVDLLERYVEFKAKKENTGLRFHSDFHQPGTYRGGMVPRLQRLLRQEPDGSFTP